MHSAESGRWRPKTRASPHLPLSSWLGEDGANSLIVPRGDRFLSALDEASVEALRTVFFQDALARPGPAEGVGGMFDRQGNRWIVFDLDGTRQTARQRALPQGPDLPPPQRRLQPVCAPGYMGRKRGEVVRTRTTLLQAHIHRWLASVGGAGNGDSRGELLRGLEVIVAYQTALGLLPAQALVRAFRIVWQWSHCRRSDRRSGRVGDAEQRLRLTRSA